MGSMKPWGTPVFKVGGEGKAVPFSPPLISSLPLLPLLLPSVLAAVADVRQSHSECQSDISEIICKFLIGEM